MNHSYRDKLIRIQDYFQEQDTLEEQTESVKEDIICILSEENPEPRDILIGVMANSKKKSIQLLKSIPEQEPYYLNVINLLIILHADITTYMNHYIDKGASLDKTRMLGTTMYELLRTESEDSYGDMLTTVEGLIINARVLAEDSDLDIIINASQDDF